MKINSSLRVTTHVWPLHVAAGCSQFSPVCHFQHGPNQASLQSSSKNLSWTISSYELNYILAKFMQKPNLQQLTMGLCSEKGI